MKKKDFERLTKIDQENYIEKRKSEAESYAKNARLARIAELEVAELTGQQIKYIFILPPDIARYLEWVAYERRMHKSQVVREAITNAAKKDKDYISYLKQS